jgi:hypothetical protein
MNPKDIAKGKRVYWTDPVAVREPGREHCSGTGEIVDCPSAEDGGVTSDSVIALRMDDGGEAEVLAHEITEIGWVICHADIYTPAGTTETSRGRPLLIMYRDRKEAEKARLEDWKDLRAAMKAGQAEKHHRKDDFYCEPLNREGWEDWCSSQNLKKRKRGGGYRYPDIAKHVVFNDQL